MLPVIVRIPAAFLRPLLLSRLLLLVFLVLLIFSVHTWNTPFYSWITRAKPGRNAAAHEILERISYRAACRTSISRYRMPVRDVGFFAPKAYACQGRWGTLGHVSAPWGFVAAAQPCKRLL
jgi:hypothetical protein